MRPRKPEEKMQKAIVARWHEHVEAGRICPEFRLFCVRNEQAFGGRMAAINGARLNALGRLSGVPDLEVATSDGRAFRGEVKAKGGSLSASQRGWRDWSAPGTWALWRSVEDAERSWREWGVLDSEAPGDHPGTDT